MGSESHSMDKGTDAILAKAVTRILKPLIRVLIKNKISHGEFTELAKQAYVDVAYQSFTISNRKTTYSRVAVLTGLSRKEVVRLTQQVQKNALPRVSAPNRAVRVVNGWVKDPDFLDKDHNPLVLNLRGEQSFSTLVSRYSGDITVGAILDELERVGVINLSDDQQVTLVSDGYVPIHDDLEKINILSICTADLLLSATHNLEYSNEDSWLQRQVVYQQVPFDTAIKFKAYSQKKSSSLLLEFNRWLANRSDQPTTQPSAQTKRIGVGIYYFEDVNKE